MEKGLTTPNWDLVERVLLVRLRSIGDSVLSTPTVSILKTEFPRIQIDIVLEDWVAPLFRSHPQIDDVLISPRSSLGRLALVRDLRKRKYDVAFNLHGGTTAGFLTAFSGAKFRVGLKTYQYPFLYNVLGRSPDAILDRPDLHSVEQQAAMLFDAAVPMTNIPPTSLFVDQESREEVDATLERLGVSDSPFALIHPLAAYPSKRWSTKKFTAVIDQLAREGIASVVLVTPDERELGVKTIDKTEAVLVDDLSLMTIPALAERARIFIGNDSGIAHIAAAMQIPVVTVFGSSNPIHWKPWTDAPNKIVENSFDCQPCPGDRCRVFGNPRCIEELPLNKVLEAVSGVLKESQ